MLFDVKTLDLRMPWTRKMDQTGDQAVSAICRALRLSSLNKARTQAIEQTPLGRWHSLLSEIIRTSDLLVQLSLDHDVPEAADGVWEIRFSVFGDCFGYERQRRRVEDAIRRFARTQEHLAELSFDYRTGRLEIKLKAKIGQITVPTLSPTA